VRRFDRFADGGHRGFNEQMLEFCKALQEAHNRLLILLILLHCVFVVEGKEYSVTASFCDHTSGFSGVLTSV
jgi:hypothetical protein